MDIFMDFSTTSPRKAMDIAFREVFEANPRIVGVDADFYSLGLEPVKDMFPERVFEVGVAESNMMGVAAGLATLGLIPFTSTMACFACTRTCDQIRVMVAQPKLNVKIMGSIAGIITGKTGKTHQAIEDIAIMRGMPNMTVLAPADAYETINCVHAMVDYDGPVYFRVPYRSVKTPIFNESDNFSIGPAVTLRQGNDVGVISTGSMTPRAVEAIEVLSDAGISVYHLHVPTIKPLDEEAVIEVARKTGCVVTAEEANILGGLGGAVAEVLGENYPVRMKRVGVKDRFGGSGTDDELIEAYEIGSKHIATAARELLKVAK